MEIPLFDVAAQFRSLHAELEAAAKEVLASGSYILGERVAAFEQALAGRCGCRFAVGVNSGTDALELSLRACGIGPGDEVLVPAFTFMATALAVTAIGATPVMADIDEASYGIDVDDAARRVTARTKAIIPVHLYGQPGDLDGVLRLAGRHRLQVIEDCAQAIGATYRGRPVGSFGHAGCFSFYPTKNLGAAGDGGAVVTSDQGMAQRLSLLRNCGTRDKVRYETFGRNSRLDELQAAILLVKLRHLDDWNEARRVRAGWYRELFAQEGVSDVGLPQELPERRHVYHLFVVRVKDRDRIQRELASRGIETAVYYHRPLHVESFYAGRTAKPGELPRAEQASREVLALPMYPELGREAISSVVRAFKEIQTRVHDSPGDISPFRPRSTMAKKGNVPSCECPRDSGGGASPPVVLSLVERGWQAARECSLELQQQGMCVIHLVKGRLSGAVHAMIAPKPHIHVVSMSRNLFWPAAWALCGWLSLTGRLRSVMVDNERSMRRVRRWVRRPRVNPVLVREGRDGYELLDP